MIAHPILAFILRQRSGTIAASGNWYLNHRVHRHGINFCRKRFQKKKKKNETQLFGLQFSIQQEIQIEKKLLCST